MWKVNEPFELKETLLGIHEKGYIGALLTGGSDKDGRLPWEMFLGAIKEVSSSTGLYLTAHTGFLDLEQAQGLSGAGVRQGLLDLMGSEDVAREVYHLGSLVPVLRAARAIKESQMEFVPHIVAGLEYGRVKSEFEALQILKDLEPECLVIVTLTPLKGTLMEHLEPPSLKDVTRLMVHARLMHPGLSISLGCERKRGAYSRHLEALAVISGIDRMAVWDEGSVLLAEALGLRPRFQLSCCSVPFFTAWLNEERV
jgi:uncharacterized radical SAM superfamily protein